MRPDGDPAKAADITMGLKKTIYLALSLALAAASLAGCGKKKEVEPVYELTPVAEDALETGKYYVKSGTDYYPVPSGTRNWSAEAPLPDGEAKFVWYGKDDAWIPTMYQDDQLIYVAADAGTQQFHWDRFEDEGYTIGVRGLTRSDSGGYVFTKQSAFLYPGSAFANGIAELPDNEVLMLDRVGGQPVEESNISKGGTVLYLTKDQTYDTDVYLGTKYTGVAGTADVHAFTGFEEYETTTYTLNQAGYAEIEIPEHFRSGFYMVNDSGVFRYVDNPKQQGITNVDFNEPYYLTDQDGNLITADEFASLNASPDTSTVSENVYSYVIHLDSTQEGMSFSIKYTDPQSTQSGSEVELANTLQPRAVLTSPDGTRHDFTYSNRQEDMLEYVMDTVVMSGDYQILIMNMDNRTFNVDSQILSGHADSFIHSGSGEGTMDYYLEKDLNDGYFTISWDSKEIDASAGVVIMNTLGDKFGASVNPADVIAHAGGSVTIDIGRAPAGTYRIFVNSENALGRVRVSYADMSSISIEQAGDDFGVRSGNVEEPEPTVTPEEAPATEPEPEPVPETTPTPEPVQQAQQTQQNYIVEETVEEYSYPIYVD